jgi:hypothetical protein
MPADVCHSLILMRVVKHVNVALRGFRGKASLKLHLLVITDFDPPQCISDALQLSLPDRNVSLTL